MIDDEVKQTSPNRFAAAYAEQNRLKSSPRTMLIAPPNLPVKDYLFIDSQREEAVRNKLLKQRASQPFSDFSNPNLETFEQPFTQADSHQFVSQPSLPINIDTQNQGRPIQSAAPKRRSKFPKPDIRLPTTPYPMQQGGKPKKSAQTTKRTTGTRSLKPEAMFQSAQIDVPQPSVDGAHKIQKLITMDSRWHQQNNLRLSAHVRQGRIPELKYYTTQYDQEKVNENKIDVMTIQNILESSGGIGPESRRFRNYQAKHHVALTDAQHQNLRDQKKLVEKFKRSQELSNQRSKGESQAQVRSKEEDPLPSQDLHRYVSVGNALSYPRYLSSDKMMISEKEIDSLNVGSEINSKFGSSLPGKAFFITGVKDAPKISETPIMQHGMFSNPSEGFIEEEDLAGHQQDEVSVDLDKMQKQLDICQEEIRSIQNAQLELEPFRGSANPAAKDSPSKKHSQPFDPFKEKVSSVGYSMNFFRGINTAKNSVSMGSALMKRERQPRQRGSKLSYGSISHMQRQHECNQAVKEQLKEALDEHHKKKIKEQSRELRFNRNRKLGHKTAQQIKQKALQPQIQDPIPQMPLPQAQATTTETGQTGRAGQTGQTGQTGYTNRQLLQTTDKQSTGMVNEDYMLLLLQKETQSSKMVDSKMNTHQDERMASQWPANQRTESAEFPISDEKIGTPRTMKDGDGQMKKSRRVLSSTLNNPNVNFKDMKITDVIRRENEILDLIDKDQIQVDHILQKQSTDDLADHKIFKYGSLSSKNIRSRASKMQQRAEESLSNEISNQVKMLHQHISQVKRGGYYPQAMHHVRQERLNSQERVRRIQAKLLQMDTDYKESSNDQFQLRIQPDRSQRGEKDMPKLHSGDFFIKLGLDRDPSTNRLPEEKSKKISKYLASTGRIPSEWLLYIQQGKIVIMDNNESDIQAQTIKDELDSRRNGNLIFDQHLQERIKQQEGVDDSLGETLDAIKNIIKKEAMTLKIIGQARFSQSTASLHPTSTQLSFSKENNFGLKRQMSPNPYSDNTKGQTLDRNSEMGKSANDGNINEDSKIKYEPFSPHESFKKITTKMHSAISKSQLSHHQPNSNRPSNLNSPNNPQAMNTTMGTIQDHLLMTQKTRMKPSERSGERQRTLQPSQQIPPNSSSRMMKVEVMAFNQGESGDYGMQNYNPEDYPTTYGMTAPDQPENSDMNTQTLEEQFTQLAKQAIAEASIPSFYERQAFKDDFRRKWRQDRGLISMFDKRQFYKQQKERLMSANNIQKTYTLRQPLRKKKGKSKEPTFKISGEQANLNYMSPKDKHHRLRFYLQQKKQEVYHMQETKGNMRESMNQTSQKDDQGLNHRGSTQSQMSQNQGTTTSGQQTKKTNNSSTTPYQVAQNQPILSQSLATQRSQKTQESARYNQGPIYFKRQMKAGDQMLLKGQTIPQGKVGNSIDQMQASRQIDMLLRT